LNKDGVLKKVHNVTMEKERMMMMMMMRRGPRIDLGKVRRRLRRELCLLPLTSIVFILFILFPIMIILCE